MGKEGVAIPFGAPKIEFHPPRPAPSGRTGCRNRSGHQVSAVARGFGRLGRAPPGSLTRAGKAWGTYLVWARLARGPSPLEGCQGAREGGCSKPGGGGGSPRPYSEGGGKRGKLRPPPLESPCPTLNHPLSQFSLGRWGSVACLASGCMGTSHSRAGRGCIPGGPAGRKGKGPGAAVEHGLCRLL